MMMMMTVFAVTPSQWHNMIRTYTYYRLLRITEM